MLCLKAGLRYVNAFERNSCFLFVFFILFVFVIFYILFLFYLLLLFCVYACAFGRLFVCCVPYFSLIYSLVLVTYTFSKLLSTWKEEKFISSVFNSDEFH